MDFSVGRHVAEPCDVDEVGDVLGVAKLAILWRWRWCVLDTVWSSLVVVLKVSLWALRIVGVVLGSACD